VEEDAGRPLTEEAILVQWQKDENERRAFIRDKKRAIRLFNRMSLDVQRELWGSWLDTISSALLYDEDRIRSLSPSHCFWVARDPYVQYNLLLPFAAQRGSGFIKFSCSRYVVGIFNLNDELQYRYFVEVGIKLWDYTLDHNTITAKGRTLCNKVLNNRHLTPYAREQILGAVCPELLKIDDDELTIAQKLAEDGRVRFDMNGRNLAIQTDHYQAIITPQGRVQKFSRRANFRSNWEECLRENDFSNLSIQQTIDNESIGKPKLPSTLEEGKWRLICPMDGQPPFLYQPQKADVFIVEERVPEYSASGIIIQCWTIGINEEREAKWQAVWMRSEAVRGAVTETAARLYNRQRKGAVAFAPLPTKWFNHTAHLPEIRHNEFNRFCIEQNENLRWRNDHENFDPSRTIAASRVLRHNAAAAPYPYAGAQPYFAPPPENPDVVPPYYNAGAQPYPGDGTQPYFAPPSENPYNGNPYAAAAQQPTPAPIAGLQNRRVNDAAPYPYAGAQPYFAPLLENPYAQPPAPFIAELQDRSADAQPYFTPSPTSILPGESQAYNGNPYAAAQQPTRVPIAGLQNRGVTVAPSYPRTDAQPYFTPPSENPYAIQQPPVPIAELQDREVAVAPQYPRTDAQPFSLDSRDFGNARTQWHIAVPNGCDGPVDKNDVFFYSQSEAEQFNRANPRCACIVQSLWFAKLNRNGQQEWTQKEIFISDQMKIWLKGRAPQIEIPCVNIVNGRPQIDQEELRNAIKIEQTNDFGEANMSWHLAIPVATNGSIRMDRDGYVSPEDILCYLPFKAAELDKEKLRTEPGNYGGGFRTFWFLEVTRNWRNQKWVKKRIWISNETATELERQAQRARVTKPKIKIVDGKPHIEQNTREDQPEPTAAPRAAHVYPG